MGEYVGCTIEEEGDNIYLSQPGLTAKLEQRYGKELTTLQRYQTAMGPGQVMLRPDDDDEYLTPEEQTEYRSGMGMLLYLLKHWRPDLSNSIRELTKVMDGATICHMKAMKRVIIPIPNNKYKRSRLAGALGSKPIVDFK